MPTPTDFAAFHFDAKAICHSFKSAPQQSETDHEVPYPGKR